MPILQQKKKEKPKKKTTQKTKRLSKGDLRKKKPTIHIRHEGNQYYGKTKIWLTTTTKEIIATHIY